MATRETFCCVGVCCVLAAGATVEDGVVGCVDMWSDCVSDGIVVGVSAGAAGCTGVASSATVEVVVGVTVSFSCTAGVSMRSRGNLTGS